MTNRDVIHMLALKAVRDAQTLDDAELRRQAAECGAMLCTVYMKMGDEAVARIVKLIVREMPDLMPN